MLKRCKTPFYEETGKVKIKKIPKTSIMSVLSLLRRKKKTSKCKQCGVTVRHYEKRVFCAFLSILGTKMCKRANTNQYRGKKRVF